MGGGSNNVTTLISHNTLITGAIINNQEGTRISQAMATRSRQIASEMELTLDSAEDCEFRFGFWAAANEYLLIEFDKSVDNNWRLTVDDTTGAEFSAVVVGAVVALTSYFLRLWVDADGTPHWGVYTNYSSMVHELATTGIAKKMTASDHFIQYWLKTEAAATKRADIDFLITEKTKAHIG